MKKQRRSRQHRPSHERWLVSYADFITLLFAFFVVLYASSRADLRKQAQVAQSIHSAFTALGIFPKSGEGKGAASVPPVAKAPITIQEDLARIKKNLEHTLSKELAAHTVSLKLGPNGLVISLREAGFYHSGAAIPRRASIPVIADADTGYGNAVNVHFAVEEIIRSGVAGLQIEDQEAPKKSGTAAGRRLIPVAEAVGKIKAAVAARDVLDPDFVICARCDGIGAEGGSFDDTLQRCVAYVEAGGADLVWLNSVQTRQQVKRACAEIPGPVLAIWGGEDAPPSWKEYDRLGLRIVLYPTIAATSGLQASWELMSDMRRRGAAALMDWNRRVATSKFGRPDVKKLLGYDKIMEIERRYLPTSAQRDYKTTWGHKTNYADAAPAAKKTKKGKRAAKPRSRG